MKFFVGLFHALWMSGIIYITGGLTWLLVTKLLG